MKKFMKIVNTSSYWNKPEIHNSNDKMKKAYKFMRRPSIFFFNSHYVD